MVVTRLDNVRASLWKLIDIVLENPRKFLNNHQSSNIDRQWVYLFQLNFLPKEILTDGEL